MSGQGADSNKETDDAENSEQGVPPTADAFAAMGRFTEGLVEAGVMVAGVPSAYRLRKANARMKHGIAIPK